MPAGDLRVVVGLFHKRDEFSYGADPVAARFLPDGRSDILGFNATDDVDGEENNTDVYLESLVPLLADLPGVQSLELGLGYRIADYDAAGTADSYKAELLYRPVDSLRLRGSLQRAVRAPGIFELFEPQLPFAFSLNPTGISGEQDPCEATSVARNGPDAAAVEALCMAQGVPADLLAEFQDLDLTGRGFAGGNPDLDAEDADTYTVGAVWIALDGSAGFGRLSASLDWYRIKVNNAIEQVGAYEVISLCFDPTNNPTFAMDNPWCTYFSRDPATGEIENLFQINRNVGGLKTSGVDLQLDWRVALGPGELGLNWLVSWLDSYERRAGPETPAEQLAGTISKTNTFSLPGGSLPEWKSNLAASYAWRALEVTARWRYVDSMRDGQVEDFDVPSRSYVDLYARYMFGPGLLGGLSMGLGIENIGDQDPPIYPSYVQANTDPSQYDVLGRRYFLRLNYRF